MSGPSHTGPTRRSVLASAGLALAGGLAGCAQLSVASFVASPATVPEATLTRTGYEERGVDERVVRQGFGPAERLVEVVNWVALYERPLTPSVLDVLPGTADPGDQRVAVFAALSTPKVEVAGREFNPVAGFSANDVLDFVQNVYGGLREVERVGERAVTVLGSATRVAEYRAAGGLSGGGTSADVDGLTDLSLHVTGPVEHGEDFVVGLAAHPAVASIERGTVDTLLGAIAHER